MILAYLSFNLPSRPSAVASVPDLRKRFSISTQNSGLSQLLKKPVLVTPVCRPALFKALPVIPDDLLRCPLNLVLRRTEPPGFTVTKGRRLPTCRHCKGITLQLADAANDISKAENLNRAGGRDGVNRAVALKLEPSDGHPSAFFGEEQSAALLAVAAER